MKVDAQEIKIALLRKGVSQRKIAQQEKVDPGFVNHVIHQKKV